MLEEPPRRENRSIKAFVLWGLLAAFGIISIKLLVDGSGSAWLAILALAVVGFFANLDRVTELQLGAQGLIAKTRELNREADLKIDTLKSMSKTFAKAVVTLTLAEGRLGGMKDHKQVLLDDLFSNMRALGLSENDIAELRDLEYPYVCFDYVSYITRQLKRGVFNNETWNEFFSADKRRGIGYEPTPEELRNFLKEAGLLSERTATLVDDYQFYREHRRHRDPTRWSRRAEWND